MKPEITIQQIVAIAPDLIGGVALWSDVNAPDKTVGCLLSPLMQPLLATVTRAGLLTIQEVLERLYKNARDWADAHDVVTETSAILQAQRDGTLFNNASAGEKP